MIKQAKGFTLIELLVVVSIISLLSSVVLTALNGARSKARNVRRNEDIYQLIIAFNLGLSTNGSYPDVSGWSCVSATCYGGLYSQTFSQNWYLISADSNVDAFLSPYLSTKSTDPSDSTRGGGGYAYMNGVSGLGAPPGNANYDLSVDGVYLNWLLEPGSGCGPGRIARSLNQNWTECMYKFE